MNLAEVLEKHIPGQPDSEVLNILGYEYGDLLKCMVYARRHPSDADAYMIEAKITTSDMLAQIQTLCCRKGWDFDELVQLGAERMAEKLEEYARRRDENSV